MAFLFAVIAFLFPIGVYCFILASINQRAKPLMVNGRWDAVGLLFACCGFFLGTIPALATDLYARFAGVVLSNAISDLWLTLWLAYFLLLLAGIIGMMMWRSHKTMIYHVDAEIFRAEEIGGIAVETVTEDAHTSLRMQTRGWNTSYINIPQAAINISLTNGPLSRSAAL